MRAWNIDVENSELDRVADESLLNWRFICFDHSQDCVRRYSSRDHLSISACFDVRNDSNKEMMRHYGHIDKK
jgi:hypothetical protein